MSARELLTCIKLPSVFKIFVFPIFEWPLKTGLTVGNHISMQQYRDQTCFSMH